MVLDIGQVVSSVNAAHEAANYWGVSDEGHSLEYLRSREHPATLIDLAIGAKHLRESDCSFMIRNPLSKAMSGQILNVSHEIAGNASRSRTNSVSSPPIQLPAVGYVKS